MWSRSSAILRYGFAVLTVAAAFACVTLVDQLLTAAPPVSLFLCAIIFVAWFAGLGPALLASALSVLAFGYFYLLPVNSLTLTSRDLPRIVLFGIASLIVASVSAAQRATAASLGRARDQLQDAVHDLETLNKELLHENVERKAAEERTRDAERELQATIDMVPALIVRYRRDGSYDFVNRTWQAYTGLPQETARGRSRELIIHPEDLATFENASRARRATDDPFDVEQRIRRADGQYRWHSVRRVPLLDEKGEVVKWYGVALDIHERKEAQAALAAAQAHLAHANRVATLGEMAASIAHEVNQPLAAIVINGEVSLGRLGLAPPDIGKVRRGVEKMIGDAKRASNVVNRIRALAKKTQVDQILVDINEVINEAITVVDREIVSHQVSLRVELAPALPLVLGDRVQLQQVIINLVVNAIQAMADVDNRARNLLIRSDRHECDQIVVEVQDSGHGFDPGNANRLFEAFYTTKPSGMGIGLSMCRTIIEAHRGRIWAANHAATGATFRFTLPVAAGTA